MRRFTQHLLRRLQHGVVRTWMKELRPDDLARSAVLFAPHQDDETLGCGGTVIKKRAAGAAVKIVFMTDGRTSHGHLMAPDRLIALRAEEALSAARVLGVDQSDVCFLAFPDGRLQEHEVEAMERVEEILKTNRPAQVFVPYRRDRTPDHVVTNQIVSSALNRLAEPVTVYEYPVWFWHHWPWVRVERNRLGMRVMQDSLPAAFGLRLLTAFRRCVPITDVLDRKREALEQHASQMRRLLPNPRWKILPDVAGGDFLECFFQPWEVFREWRKQ
jgi:LmbE family N-acetylglucosaminyl deacetylase